MHTQNALPEENELSIPRPEYPRPQFVRPDWLCLNGEWEFEIDSGDSGHARNLITRRLSDKIIVPFCPESKLSGLEHTDFMLAVWYRKEATVPPEWAGRKVLLHFGAVDYDTTVWVNGQEVGRHRGGFTPFSCVLDGVQAGETATIVVRARDDWRPPQARGKQSQQYAPHGCLYTRTTGIWQTVWLEPVPEIALRRPRLTPDVANGLIRLEQPLTGNKPGLALHATLKDAAGVVAEASVRADLDLAPRLDLAIPEERRRLWSPEDPHLYDVEIALRDAGGNLVDAAASYAGLRSVAIDGKAIKLNGKAVFQRLVLDQGYYTDGVMTAPSDEALIADITMSQAVGFNGARLHQKVFEERFLYHADRLGYLVWGEFGDWGCGGYGPRNDHQRMDAAYVKQWLEALERDYSHPSIIGWCPLNETHQPLTDVITQLDDVTQAMYLATKAMDTTRPVLDTSGYSHRVLDADVYDAHDYISEKDWETGIAHFRERHAHMAEGKVFVNEGPSWSVPYRGQPYFVSEFGGFKWVDPTHAAEQATSWGYGGDPTSLEDFYKRFQAKCDILLDNPHMFGYCYTQLTDIYPELNGIYTFDRRPKFDAERLKQIQERPAAIEAASE
ncbi:MAG: beta-galactosidase [Armatimonadetes bacterium]|nr:beta-galactosidase [Armatimonadota bacterium]